MVKRLSCLPSKQAARVRLPFGVYTVRNLLGVFLFFFLFTRYFFFSNPLEECTGKVRNGRRIAMEEGHIIKRTVTVLHLGVRDLVPFTKRF